MKTKNILEVMTYQIDSLTSGRYRSLDSAYRVQFENYGNILGDPL